MKAKEARQQRVLSEAQTLYNRWPQLPTDDKHKIAESIVEKIVVGDDHIHITLPYLPSSEETTKNPTAVESTGGRGQRSIKSKRIVMIKDGRLAAEISRQPSCP